MGITNFIALSIGMLFSNWNLVEALFIALEDPINAWLDYKLEEDIS